MSDRLKRIGVVLVAGVLLLGGVVAWGLSPRPGLSDPPAPPTPSDPDARVAELVARSQSLDVWPTATERLLRASDGPTDVAFLYIHGFGATRGEGEYVVDALSGDWGANVYYTRLPGHGQDMEAHASTDAQEWLDTAAEALAITDALGDKVVVVGTSTGAAIATWLAATYPDRVHALILASPFFDYPDPSTSRILGSRGGISLAKLAYGSVRDCRPTNGLDQPGYEDHWLVWQRYDALASLERVRRHCTRDGLYGDVRQPVLMMYHWASPTDHDPVVSIDAMRSAYAAFHDGDPHPRSRQIVVADSDHVMLSEFVRTDKQAVRKAIDVFLNQVL